MSAQHDLATYVNNTFVYEDATLRTIRESTPTKGLPAISVSPDDGQFLQMLARMVQARLIIEIGTLGGYSGSWLARALPPTGKLITLEYEKHHAEVAQEHFAAAGVADRVQIVLGDAHVSLSNLVLPGAPDMVFIDAEKTGYPDYLKWAVEHVRVGGVIVAHNALQGGRVIADPDPKPGTLAIREYNRAVGANKRLQGMLYPGGDGMTIAVKIA